MATLSEVSRYVPTDIKTMCACVNCKLIMNEVQWSKLRGACPNCRVEVDTT